MNEVLVKVDGLQKKFCKDFKRSLRYGATDILREILGLKLHKELRKEEFWALNNISFELRRGECIGLIGQNGAGKSTLLKMLNGLIKPDKGEIEMKGRVCALIELGAGFNPVLTGRENVFNYGAVLGFTHQEILSMYRDIVEFAEMQGFMETPVQNYSSGMKVRLGFAVAAQMKPDVLIIDEVLAVGDVKFRAKCLDRINQLLQNAAVILVSHQMGHVARLSTSILLLDKGGISYIGADVDLGIKKYLDKQETELIVQNESNGIRITDCQVNISTRITIEMEIDFQEVEIEEYAINLQFYNDDQRPVAIFPSTGKIDLRKTARQTTIKATLVNQFTQGRYIMNIKIFRLEIDGVKLAASFMNIAVFKVESAIRNSAVDIVLKGEFMKMT